MHIWHMYILCNYIEILICIMIYIYIKFYVHIKGISRSCLFQWTCNVIWLVLGQYQKHCRSLKPTGRILSVPQHSVGAIHRKCQVWGIDQRSTWPHHCRRAHLGGLSDVFNVFHGLVLWEYGIRKLRDIWVLDFMSYRKSLRSARYE